MCWKSTPSRIPTGHALQRRQIGDPELAREARLDAARRELAIDLRPRAVHQHQLRAEAVQQRQVVDEGLEVGAVGHLAAERDHEHAAVVGVDIGRSSAQGGDEIGGEHARIIGGAISRPGLCGPATNEKAT